MSSYPYKHLCTHCKLNKNCDHKCMEARYSFFFCPRFVNDDGQPFTNAETLITKLKDDVEVAGMLIWALVKSEEFKRWEDFVEWLKESSYE